MKAYLMSLTPRTRNTVFGLVLAGVAAAGSLGYAAGWLDGWWGSKPAAAPAAA